VATVGLIPQGLPSVTMPDLALVTALVPGALGMALMSFTETIAAGRAFAVPDDPAINPNRELLATGAANLGGALTGAMPAGGGTSQTAVVRNAGGRSQKASPVTAGAAVATMLLLAPLLGLLPFATLATVVIVYSIGLIQPAEFRNILRVRKMEFRWSLIAFLGVLVFGTLKGIVVAIIVSMIALASQAANPRVYVIGRKRGADVLRPLSPEHPDDETFDGLLILRPEGRLFFLNAQNVSEQIDELVSKYKPRVLALDMSRVPDLEYSAMQMLVEGEKRTADRGTIVWLVGLNPGVLEVVRHAGLDQRLGPKQMLFNARAAIEQYQAMQVAGGMSPPAGPLSEALLHVLERVVGSLVTPDLALRKPDFLGARRLVRDLLEQVADEVQPHALLVLRPRHVPRRPRGVGGREHLVARLRVVVPAIVGLQVHRRELPDLAAVVDTVAQAPFLLLGADLEPVLQQDDSGLHHPLLEQRYDAQEIPCLLLFAETHHPLDTGAVVPAAVEDHDFTGRREMLHVALCVHLRLLSLGRRGQRHNPEHPRAHPLGDRLDGAALAGAVTAFEYHAHLEALQLDPFLELYELHVQAFQLPGVFLVGQPLLVCIDRRLWFRLHLWLQLRLWFFLVGHDSLRRFVNVRRRHRTPPHPRCWLDRSVAIDQYS